MGKGKRQGQVGDIQKAYGNKEQGIQDEARNADTPFLKSLIPGGNGPLGVGGSFPGSNASIAPGMSPYASAQYGADVENVNRVYNNLRQGAYKALGATGFGNAPSGREASMNNTLNEGKAQQLTGAFRTGQANTLNEGLAASSAMEGRQSLYNPNATYAGATSSYAASDQARGQQISGIVNDALGVAGAAAGFVPGAAGKAMKNFGSLPGGSATNIGQLPLGSMGSSMNLDSGGGYAAPQSASGFGRYARSAPGTWAGV